jgi:hypothetical protein
VAGRSRASGPGPPGDPLSEAYLGTGPGAYLGDIWRAENFTNFLYNYVLIFITIPVTVENVERSFSVLKRVKLCSVRPCQDRLSSLGVLVVEKEQAKNTNLDAVINDFVMKKARKGTL